MLAQHVQVLGVRLQPNNNQRLTQVPEPERWSQEDQKFLGDYIASSCQPGLFKTSSKTNKLNIDVNLFVSCFQNNYL